LIDETDGTLPPRDDDPDAGPPIAELAGLGIGASPGFVDRVRRSIGRRMLGSQLAALAWHAPTVWLVEFLGLIAGLLGTGARRKGDS